MDWHCLGHAMWLCEAKSLRILCDPLLENLHHGGVFEVFPERRIAADALRADFVFVSHRHPDHFDPRSLKKLAELDPDSVLVTPDPLVEDVGRRLGFTTTRLISPDTKIDLDGPTIVTTPSPHATDPEWGFLVATDDGVAWNQVDTSLGSVADVDLFFERAASALLRPRAELVTLALARWQPLLEVESSLADRIGFPFAAYASELDHLAAVGAKVACPAAAGARHADRFDAMNRLVYPVPQERFLRDARARLSRTSVVPFATGATYRIRNHEVVVDERGAIDEGLVTLSDPSAMDPRDFRPLAIPALVDPRRVVDEGALRERIDRWIHGPLASALAREKPFVRVLEVVYPSGPSATTFAGASVKPGVDPAWDLRCAVAASFLDDVLEGRLSWGDVLLAGLLRAASRAYTVDSAGLHRQPEQPLFVYHALSYEESVVRSVECTIRQI